MTKDVAASRILQLFAEMLEYPRPALAMAVGECKALISPGSTEGGALLCEFQEFVEKTALGRLEEIYTGTFDLNATCHPYVGFHLFGESYKRSVFMLGLKERYRAQNFTIPGNDLPDHITIVLRFLATCEDAEMAQPLVQDALLPTVKRMVGREHDESGSEHGIEAEQSENRTMYQRVLEALLLHLQSLTPGSERSATRVETLTA
ncbi:MAG: nitrate reductase molybdenum cofactor assembly chaperone [Dehalococcoidia bacterium]|nr:nitrate reductase molybdenum cofactor assembly chaperone [Dehalococcoidia bacterium]